MVGDRSAADILVVADVLQPGERNLLVAGIRGLVVASVGFLVNGGPAKRYHRAAAWRIRQIWITDSVVAKMAPIVHLLRKAVTATPWSVHIGEPTSQQHTRIVGCAEEKTGKCHTMRSFTQSVARCAATVAGVCSH